MDKMAFLLCLLVSASAQGNPTFLTDGGTVVSHSEENFSTQKYYSFYVDQVLPLDLVFSLTVFSDDSDPDLYIKVNGLPSLDDYDFSSSTIGAGTVVIPPYQIRPYSNYYVMVLCYSVCHYGITVSYLREKVLTEGTPMTGHLDQNREAVYSFAPGAMKGNILTITLSTSSGKADLFVSTLSGFDPNHHEEIQQIEKTFDGKSVFKTYYWNEMTLYRVSVLADENSDYTLLAKSSKSNATLIKTSEVVNGEVTTNEIEFYYFKVLKPNETISISLTILTGDGDIYVRAGDLPGPSNFDFSSVHYGNENLVISAEDRKRINKTTGDYYIGIFGFSHSAFTLVVTSSNSSIVKLTPGFPQSGSVKNSSFLYFELPFPEQDANISIILSTTFGNPDLFARLCMKEASKCLIKEKDLNSSDVYSSRHSTGSESIEIQHNASICSNKKKEACKYLIGVYGVSDYSIFTITAITNDTEEIILRDGKPLTITLGDFKSKFFKFVVFNETASKVDFLLTPIYGNPDLYGSFNSFADLMSFDKFSYKDSFEIDSISWTKGIDADSLKGIYHIMVLTSDASSFSIVAKTSVPSWNSTLQIYPGHPQKDTLFNLSDRDYRLYSFQIHYQESEKQVITISLTPITGTFELYAANSISCLDWKTQLFHYNWTANYQNHSDLTSTIVINPNDPAYLNDSTYLVLVLGKTFLEDNSSTYVVSFTAGDGLLTLSADTPHTGVVSINEYAYFMFPVHFYHEDVTISLTALSGDADLFVSLDPETTRPTHEKFDLKSATFGDEKITINWEAGIKTHCPTLPKDYKVGDKVNCNVYISVYGFSTSTFIITVRPSTGFPAFLPANQPSHNSLTAGEYQFFYTFISASKGFKMNLQVESGDPDLYVNILDKNESGSDVDKWIRPNKEEHDYSSQTSVNNEEISDSSDILKKKCPSGNCLVVASVFCSSFNCSYFIQTGEKNETQVLVENQPTSGMSNKSFVYYSYYNNANDSHFLVTVTVINYCNPNLYISKGKNNRPTEDKYDWSSTNWGGDSILITKDDPYFKNNSNSTMKGTYVIGVLDNWQSCSFSIIVNNHPTPIIKMVPGLPQAGNLTIDSVSYYSYTNYISKDVIINLTPSFGSGSIYVLSFSSLEGDIYQHLPGPDRYNWSSDISKERYRLNISTSHQDFCIYCSYVIAVKSSNSTPFVYSLTAQNSFKTVILQNGVPVKSESDLSKPNIFRFDVKEKIDLDISITSYTGGPTLYVTTSKDLKQENYQWTKYYLQGTSNLKISANDEKFKIGSFYFIVESYEPSIYSIVAHTKNSPILLVDGWPVSYSQSAQNNSKVHFTYLAIKGHMVFCSVKCFSSTTPTIYTKFQALVGPTEIPSEKNHDHVYRNNSFISTPGSGNNSSQVFMNLPHSDEKRLISIGVYSYQNSSSDVLFQVHCSSSTQSTVLRLDISNIEILDEDINSKRYEIATPTKGQLSAFVVPCLGQFRLEISSNWTQIKNEGPDFVSTSLSDGVLLGSVNNAQGYYYITVSNKKETKSMQIYEMFALFTPSGKTLPKLAKPGNNGIISWDPKDDRHLSVSWKPIEDEDGNDLSGNVTYMLVLANSSSYLISSCAIHYYQNRGTVTVLGMTSLNYMEVEIPVSGLFISVLAYLPRDSNSPIKQVVYDPTEVFLNNRIPAGDDDALTLLLLGLLICAVAAAGYFWNQKRRRLSILNYEMSDVRNIGSVRSHDKTSDPYSSL